MDVNCLDKPLKIIKMCTMPCGYVCNPWNLLKKKKSAFLKAEQKLDACLRTVKMMLLSPQSTVKTYEDGVELLMFFLFCYLYSTVTFPWFHVCLIWFHYLLAILIQYKRSGSQSSSLSYCYLLSFLTSL